MKADLHYKLASAVCPDCAAGAFVPVASAPAEVATHDAAAVGVAGAIAAVPRYAYAALAPMIGGTEEEKGLEGVEGEARTRRRDDGEAHQRGSGKQDHHQGFCGLVPSQQDDDGEPGGFQAGSGGGDCVWREGVIPQCDD